nr:helix-turn-helix transcriptional regulator [Lampropedia puyangensis]
MAQTSAFVENLGIAVRQLREKQGWSQEQLADRSGLNRSYVGEVERGRVVASVVTAHKLAQAFEVSLVELFSRCENIEQLRRKPQQHVVAA